jgi:hypothetical protein
MSAKSVDKLPEGDDWLYSRLNGTVAELRPLSTRNGFSCFLGRLVQSLQDDCPPLRRQQMKAVGMSKGLGIFVSHDYEQSGSESLYPFRRMVPLKRENDYYGGPGAKWDCGLICYAAARDAICWQLNRSEHEALELLSGFDECSRNGTTA